MTDHYFCTEGPQATEVVPCSRDYFIEGLLSQTGAFRVVLPDGDVEHVTGTRYLTAAPALAAGVPLTADVIDDRLEIRYLGTVLRSYDKWLHVEAITDSDV